MALSKAAADSRPRGERVLDAAERLLREGDAQFSMRDLASAAGVSFATPFNQFGSKAAIMHALSARRVDTMMRRFAQANPPADTAARLRLAIDTAVSVMLEEADVNRAVMSWIGTAGPIPATTWARSSALWALALDPAGLQLEDAAVSSSLSRQIALAFRGALSFWTAGELSDEDLGPAAQAVAATLLAGFSNRDAGEAKPVTIAD